MIPREFDAQIEMGLRCPGCKEPIVDGYEWAASQLINHPEAGLVRAAQTGISCQDESCPHTAALLVAAPTMARRAFSWEWISDPDRDEKRAATPGGIELPAGSEPASTTNDEESP